MNNVITNTTIKVQSMNTGRVYNAQYVVELPAGEYGMVRAWIRIDTQYGAFIEAYKPTAREAIDALRMKLAGHWTRA